MKKMKKKKVGQKQCKKRILACNFCIAHFLGKKKERKKKEV